MGFEVRGMRRHGQCRRSHGIRNPYLVRRKFKSNVV